MEIKKQEENGTIRYTVTVGEADYGEAVDKMLRKTRQKANIPGFRVGMVPMGVINKMYRKGAVAEEAYRAASKAAVDDLNAAKIQTLGELIPSESQPELDFDTQTEFEFVFEIGVAPSVNIALTKKDKVTKYAIQPTEEMKKPQEGDPRTPEQIEAQLETQFARESEFKYTADFRALLIKKANLTLPDNYLKYWLFSINEGKFTKEQIEADYPAFADMMRWDLIERHYAEALKLEVSAEEALTEAKSLASMQFAYYGMGNIGDEMLENYAKQMLSNPEEGKRIYGKVFENKVIKAVEEQITVAEKKVSVEDFNKLFEKK